MRENELYGGAKMNYPNRDILRFIKSYNRTAGPIWKQITGWDEYEGFIVFVNCRNKEILRINFPQEASLGVHLSR